MSSVSESSWFNLLRMAGAVTTTSSPALFNVRYGGKKKRGKKTSQEDDDESQLAGRVGRSI